AMSTEIVPIAYHVNLTVVAGVLLGPWLGIVSAFIVVLMLSLLGHGGITVVGLNACIIAAEMVLGWTLVRALVKVLGRRRIRWAAGIATVVTLAITTSMLVGIVALGGSGATARETGALDAETLRFANPLSGGAVSIGLFGGGEHAAHDQALSVRRFASVVYTLGPIGWVIEALITAWILGYVARVRPTLVFAGVLAEEHRTIIGDEHGGQ
ncbi:MAG: energy-coupling factor ABC transporter permease, partial [Coriobacteriales bacterium]